MNKLKEILKEGWDVYPAWLWTGNIFCIVLALSVILFVWLKVYGFTQYYFLLD